MPGACSPSLPPTSCGAGSRLRHVEGTPCHDCYAERLRKAYPSAAKRWTQNVRTLRRALQTPEGRSAWVAAGAVLLWDESERFESNRVRWHVAGDIQSPDHLEMIAQVCRLTPKLRHRLPTQESAMLAFATRRGFQAPPNLKITVSLPRQDAKAPAPSPAFPYATSNVWTRDHLEEHKPAGLEHKPAGFVCPAVLNHTPCLDCAACWPGPQSRQHVIYPKH